MQVEAEDDLDEEEDDDVEYDNVADQDDFV